MPTTRVEGFSDGVFAIAITLLVLEIKVPQGDGELGHQLLRQWPSYAAYAISFLTVGVAWIYHHARFAAVARADQGLMMLNLLLLMTVALIPFPTAVMARYLLAGDGQELAVALYSAALLAMGLASFAVTLYTARRRMLDRELSQEEMSALVLHNSFGPALYALAIGLAFVSAYAALGLCALGGCYYLLPGRLVS